MPVILNNKKMAISDIGYQNKHVLDIFSDKDYPTFILMNSNIFCPVDILPSLKKKKKWHPRKLFRCNLLDWYERNGNSGTKVFIFFLTTAEKISWQKK